MNRKKVSTFDVINVTFMCLLMVSFLYPFIYMINVSLSSELHIMRESVSLWPKGFTWEWYERTLGDVRIPRSYFNTILYTVLGTVISLLATSAGAFALAQKYMILRTPLMLLIIFTIMFGGGMIPTFLLVSELGLLNTIWAMVLPGAVSTFHLLVFRTFFEGIPVDLLDAGKIDGLSEIGLFRRIIMPLSKPVYAAIGLFEAVGLWNNFEKALLYIRDETLWPLTMLLRELIIENAIDDSLGAEAVAGGPVYISDGLKFATLMVTILPIIFLYPFLQKYFVKGVLIGSVKG